jgi:hypothetical protein
MNGRESGREVHEMLNVSVEVQSGAARFRVAVQAESIQRALSLVGGRFPRMTCRVRFPMEAKGFFVEDPDASAGIVESDDPKEIAA